MFIKKLKLKNFKCFANLELDFEEKKGNRLRTIILGENGTGKTNILKAISLVTIGSTALGENLGDANDWIKFGEDMCRIDLEMTNFKNELRHISLEIHKDDTLKDIIDRSSESLNEIDAALKHAERNYFVLAYGATRVSGNGEISINSRFRLSNRSLCVASLLDKNSYLHSIQEWAINLDYTDENALSIIRSVFDDLLPNINFYSIDRKKRKLLIETEDGIIPFEALSDGYQNMAALLGDLLYRINNIFQDRNEPLQTRGVLLIDEVGLHLHPIWQRKLLDFIKKTLPNMQLIATTHSPFIAQQAGKDELFTIERNNKKLEINQFTGNPQSLLIHQILMSDIFGISTDESFEIEQIKQEKSFLLDKDELTENDEKSLKSINNTLKNRPVRSYSNSLINEEEHIAMKEFLKSFGQKSEE